MGRRIVLVQIGLAHDALTRPALRSRDPACRHSGSASGSNPAAAIVWMLAATMAPVAVLGGADIVAGARRRDLGLVGLRQRSSGRHRERQRDAAADSRNRPCIPDENAKGSCRIRGRSSVAAVSPCDRGGTRADSDNLEEQSDGAAGSSRVGTFRGPMERVAWTPDLITSRPIVSTPHDPGAGPGG